jgi:hypothetical protein
LRIDVLGDPIWAAFQQPPTITPILPRTSRDAKRMTDLMPDNTGDELLGRSRRQALQSRVITANQDHSQVFDPHSVGLR